MCCWLMLALLCDGNASSLRVEQPKKTDQEIEKDFQDLPKELQERIKKMIAKRIAAHVNKKFAALDIKTEVELRLFEKILEVSGPKEPLVCIVNLVMPSSKTLKNHVFELKTDEGIFRYTRHCARIDEPVAFISCFYHQNGRPDVRAVRLRYKAADDGKGGKWFEETS